MRGFLLCLAILAPARAVPSHPGANNLDAHMAELEAKVDALVGTSAIMREESQEDGDPTVDDDTPAGEPAEPGDGEPDDSPIDMEPDDSPIDMEPDVDGDVYITNVTEPDDSPNDMDFGDMELGDVDITNATESDDTATVTEMAQRPWHYNGEFTQKIARNGQSSARQYSCSLMPTIYRSKLFTWQGRNGKYGAHYVKVKCWSYSRKKWFYILRYNHADMRKIAGTWYSPPNLYYTPNSDGKKRKCTLALKGMLFYRIPYDDYVPENKVTCGRHMLPIRKMPVSIPMCADRSKWNCGSNIWRRGKKYPRYTCGAGPGGWKTWESRCQIYKPGTWPAKSGRMLFGNKCLCTWSDPKYVTKCTRQLVKNRYSHKYRARITRNLSPSRKDRLNSRRLFSYFCRYA